MTRVLASKRVGVVVSALAVIVAVVAVVLVLVVELRPAAAVGLEAGDGLALRGVVANHLELAESSANADDDSSSGSSSNVDSSASEATDSGANADANGFTCQDRLGGTCACCSGQLTCRWFKCACTGHDVCRRQAGPGLPFCYGYACVQCLTNADCGDGRVCLPNKRCGAPLAHGATCSHPDQCMCPYTCITDRGVNTCALRKGDGAHCGSFMSFNPSFCCGRCDLRSTGKCYGGIAGLGHCGANPPYCVPNPNTPSNSPTEYYDPNYPGQPCGGGC